MMNLAQLRVVFMGTPAFAVPALEGLYQLGCQIVGVVSQPDRPQGRGRRVVPTAVASVARQRGTPLFQWPRLNNQSYRALSELQPDLIVVVAYGKILPKRYLDLPKLGCLNVHASLLPHLRGAAPIQWAVIRGYRKTGVSIMRLDEGMDTGDVAQTASTLIGETETAGDLHDRLARLGVEPLQRVVSELCEGQATFQSQDHQQATHAPMLRKADGRMIWTKSCTALYDHVRGMSPWPGAFIHLDEGPLKIYQVSRSQRQGRAGVVLAHEAVGPVVGCAEGSLVLLKVQRPGRKAVTGADFIRGGGARLGEPIEGC